jgi:hypothetical protein
MLTPSVHPHPQGICTTALKRACRKVGIQKWPFRNERKSDKKPATSNSSASESELSEQCTEAGERHSNGMDSCSSDDCANSDRRDAYCENTHRVTHKHQTRSQQTLGEVKREAQEEEPEDDDDDDDDEEDGQDEDEEEAAGCPDQCAQESMQQEEASQDGPGGEVAAAIGDDYQRARHDEYDSQSHLCGHAKPRMNDLCESLEVCVMMSTEDSNVALDAQDADVDDWLNCAGLNMNGASLNVSGVIREYPDVDEWKWCLKNLAVRCLYVCMYVCTRGVCSQVFAGFKSLVSC